MKFSKFVISLLAAAMLFTGCGNTNADQTTKTNKSESMDISVLSIGKADCSVITMGDSVLVIDGGEAEDGEEITAYLEDCGITKIDTLIVTHFDKDHIGGIPDILDGFLVDTVYQPDYGRYEKDSDTYADYLDALSKSSCQVQTLEDTTSLTIAQMEMTIYPPLQDYYGDDEENDFSLVTVLEYGDCRFLFAGDSETLRLQELYTQITDWAFDFLKVPHHGVYEDGTSTFLKKVHPSTAVICCSNKKFADTQTLSVLESIGSDTYCTNEGLVRIHCDGTSLETTQENEK